jgi:hypothetical protein
MHFWEKPLFNFHIIYRPPNAFYGAHFEPFFMGLFSSFSAKKWETENGEETVKRETGRGMGPTRADVDAADAEYFLV